MPRHLYVPKPPSAEPVRTGVRARGQSHESCEHDWQVFPVPGERPGRVFQCSKCKGIGARRWNKTKVFFLTCTLVENRKRCQGVAVVRLYGRGLRDSFRWACSEHAEEALAREHSAR